MVLNKETISNFDNEEMNRILGKGDCGPICNCKVMTCRTCFQGTCTCSIMYTHIPDCPETITDCPQYP